MRCSLTAFFLSGLILVAPASAWAEGALRLLECRLQQACDSSATCEPADGEVEFSMEPLELDANGSGSYNINYDDNEAEMQARSFAGPFLWTVNGEMHSLLANSETSFLWHRLAFEPTPEATITFMACEFTQ